jgi:hypothetical protein
MLSLILRILKVPKCEIFDLFDFNDFYVMKSLKVGGFRDEIKKTEHTKWQASVQSSELGPPHTQAIVAPHHMGPGGSHTRLRGREWGDPIPTKGQKL